MKILNGRMITCVAGRYMFKNGWIYRKMLPNPSCKMFFCFTNIGLVLITRTFKKINDICLSFVFTAHFLEIVVGAVINLVEVASSFSLLHIRFDVWTFTFRLIWTCCLVCRLIETGGYSVLVIWYVDLLKPMDAWCWSFGMSIFIETGGCLVMIVWYVGLLRPVDARCWSFVMWIYWDQWMLGDGRLVCWFIEIGGCLELVVWYVNLLRPVDARCWSFDMSIYWNRWMLGAGRLVCRVILRPVDARCWSFGMSIYWDRWMLGAGCLVCRVILRPVDARCWSFGM